MHRQKRKKKSVLVRFPLYQRNTINNAKQCHAPESENRTFRCKDSCTFPQNRRRRRATSTAAQLMESHFPRAVLSHPFGFHFHIQYPRVYVEGKLLKENRYIFIRETESERLYCYQTILPIYRTCYFLSKKRTFVYIGIRRHGCHVTLYVRVSIFQSCCYFT